MADRRRRLAPVAETPKAVLTASGLPNSPLIAAGGSGRGMGEVEAYNQYLNYGWQLQAWAYYHAIGPFNYGVNWLGAAMSRVALIVAEAMPGVEEPVPVDSGPAMEILNQIKWDESSIMKALSLQISVPGRGYLVGRDPEIAGAEREWCVYSPQQVRPVPVNKRRGYEYELWEWGGEWVPLDNALVVVIREPDPCYTWLDVSNAQAALTILREIDLYDKDIVSSLVSRLANNGILLVPAEVSFPTREQYNDNDDPFMLELIEVARTSIKDPGSASAAIPIPLKVPAQFIDKFKHLVLASGVDQIVLDARHRALEILAQTLNLPKEVVLGMGDSNHWSTREIADAAISSHISPIAEIICRGLTRGFLHPQLVAERQSLAGPNGGKLVVWYDTSALAARPDLSDKAVDLYDRLELSGDALRRETGFSEDDVPDKSELRDQILKKAASQAQLALTALAELTGPSAKTPQRTDSEQEQDAVSQEEGRGATDAPVSQVDTKTPEATEQPS